MTGVNLVHVPYRGGAPALVDMLTGQVQVMFDNLPTSIEHIRSGKLRALAVTVGKRWPALPDVPTVGETVPGLETSLWYGIVAPKGTPPEIINKLNQAINAVLADPKVAIRLAELGGVPMPMSPAEFGHLIVDDTEKWANVIKAAGVKME
jgi:tripartite-type tricarboxylate transporter receptor subunit TctC